MAVRRSAPELVIITGLSGSGKGTVLKTLEDNGYYSVENLPLELMPKFAELTKGSANIRRAALVVDIREGDQLQSFPVIYSKLRRKIRTRLVFLDAAEDVLIRRYSETRRPHPLGTGRSLIRNVRAERKRLEPIKALADHVVDTTQLSVHQLRKRIVELFGSPDETKLRVSVMSFGFRHGVPPESDLVFDVRFLPNPHFVPALRKFSGKDAPVARYIHGFPQTGEFLERISSLLLYLLPHYVAEGKSYLTISFGCTGGHHRSVMMAEELGRALAQAGYSVNVTHRDIDKKY